MNDWVIAVVGGVIGSLIVLTSSQKSLFLKQILIIGIVGYISLALLLLYDHATLAVFFLLVGVGGFIGKKILDTGRIRIPMIMEGGERYE